MSLFDSLLIAHLVGDWLLQTEWQALEKARNWRALWSHVAVYHALLLAVLLVRIPGRRPEILIAVGLLALSHAWLDRGWPVLRIVNLLRVVRARDAEPWLVRIADQILHVALLGVTAWYLAPRGPF